MPGWMRDVRFFSRLFGSLACETDVQGLERRSRRLIEDIWFVSFSGVLKGWISAICRIEHEVWGFWFGEEVVVGLKTGLLKWSDHCPGIRFGLRKETETLYLPANAPVNT